MSKDKQKVKEKNKGITLIALIITIIVMLILVAVTVTVALNGGLFKTAKEATSQTEVEKEKELLLEEVMGAIGKDGKVDFEKLETTFETTGTENGEFFVITESGRKYTITERGSINLLSNEGGGETPPTGGEEPEEPGIGETSGAGLYETDGTFTSWANLLNSGIVTVENGVLTSFAGYENIANTNTWEPIVGELVIDNSVTSIGDYAFQACTGLSTITIPNSVTSIGYSLFSNCVITEVNVEESNPNYCSDAGILYNKDKTTILCYPMGKTEGNFVFPDSVTSIGEWAFNGCSSLTSVEIPSRVTSIGERAFNACTSLTELIIPNGVTSIGGGTFDFCVGLTTVTIPDSVTSIDDGAFRSCTSLTATIQGSNVYVSNRAFWDVPTVYYAGYVEGTDYSSWKAGQVLPIPSGI